MPPTRRTLLDAKAMRRTLIRIAHEIAEKNPEDAQVVLVGVQRGGTFFAHRLAEFLQGIWDHPVPVGLLDVSMHRDDLGQRPSPEIHPTTIPFDLQNKLVVLVDDVLFSGRTTRAAMDALNDFGRPKAIQLAVLIDRGHRELPIKATFVGKNVPTLAHERVHVHWQEEGGQDRVDLGDA